MKKKTFTRIREIINDFEKCHLPIIKQELAACKTEEDYVYGKQMRIDGKPISCCGLYNDIIECDGEKYENDDAETTDFSKEDILNLYEIVYSDNVEFSSPNPHQKRIYGGNLANDVINTLKKIPDIQGYRFTHFEHLYDIVRAIFEINNHSYAFLTMYDTALRIGYNHQEPIMPEKFVYLYGTSEIGPLSGATRLYGSKWVNNHYDKDYKHRIKTRWFNDEFPNLPSWEIESILCIYAKAFRKGMKY